MRVGQGFAAAISSPALCTRNLRRGAIGHIAEASRLPILAHGTRTLTEGRLVRLTPPTSGQWTFYFFAPVRGRPRGRSVNSRPIPSVGVILVKHILPRVAAVQNVLANPADGSSCVIGIAPCYNKSRSGSQQTVTKKKNVPVSFLLFLSQGQAIHHP